MDCDSGHNHGGGAAIEHGHSTGHGAHDMGDSHHCHHDHAFGTGENAFVLPFNYLFREITVENRGFYVFILFTTFFLALLNKFLKRVRARAASKWNYELLKDPKYVRMSLMHTSKSKTQLSTGGSCDTEFISQGYSYRKPFCDAVDKQFLRNDIAMQNERVSIPTGCEPDVNTGRATVSNSLYEEGLSDDALSAGDKESLSKVEGKCNTDKTLENGDVKPRIGISEPSNNIACKSTSRFASLLYIKSPLIYEASWTVFLCSFFSLTIDYGLMLVAMTFDYGIFICIILGFAVGQLM